VIVPVGRAEYMEGFRVEIYNANSGITSDFANYWEYS
jgi:hypothetical protein